MWRSGHPWRAVMLDCHAVRRAAHGTRRPAPLPPVIKEVPKAVLLASGGNWLARERDVLAAVGPHPCVVALLGTCQTPDAVGLVLEALRGGDLASHIRCGVLGVRACYRRCVFERRRPPFGVRVLGLGVCVRAHPPIHVC